MRQFTKIEKEAPIDFENFRIHMQREMILRKLKEGGYRITKHPDRYLCGRGSCQCISAG